MTTKVQKWGNSLGVRIPREIAHEVRMREGSRISFSVEGGTLLLTHSKKPAYTLNGLLKGFDKKTQHEMVEWGTDVGGEKVVW